MEARSRPLCPEYPSCRSATSVNLYLSVSSGIYAGSCRPFPIFERRLEEERLRAGGEGIEIGGGAAAKRGETTMRGEDAGGERGEGDGVDK